MSLEDDIRERARMTELPFGGQGEVLGLTDTAALARWHNLPGFTVESAALDLGIYPTRYLRNQQSITSEQQIALLGTRLAMVGLGGLGGTLLEIFLRTGIGSIQAADGDVFEETNINRQALSTPALMNAAKADAAARRGIELNPSVNLNIRNEFLTEETLPGFLHGADIAVDALGGLSLRPALQAAAASAKIPLVTGALAGWTGYVSVVMPDATGPADIMGTNNGAEEQLGCPAPAVSLIASLMACEVVRLRTEESKSLPPSMLLVDLQTLTFERIQL